MPDKEQTSGDLNISNSGETNIRNAVTGDIEGDVVGGNKIGGDQVNRDKQVVTAGTYIEKATIVLPGLAITAVLVLIAGLGWFAFQMNRPGADNLTSVPNFTETEAALREAIYATVTADALVSESPVPDSVAEDIDRQPTLPPASPQAADTLPTSAPSPLPAEDIPVVIEIEVTSAETGENVSGAVAAVVGEVITALGQSGKPGVIKIQITPSFQNYSAELIVTASGYEPYTDVIDIVGQTLEIALTPTHSEPIHPDNLKDIMVLKRLEGQVGPILQVAFNPNGNLLASSGGNGTINLWSVPDGGQWDTEQRGSAWVQGLSFSPTGQRFATASDDSQIRLWELGTDQPIVEVNSGHEDFVFNLEFSPTSEFLVSGSGDGTAKIWNAENLTEIITLDVSDTATYETAITSDGARLATASIDGVLRLWDVSTTSEICTFDTGESVLTVDFRPDDEAVAIGTTKADIIIVDAVECNSLMVLQGHVDNVNSVAYSPDGKLLASGSKDNTVRIWSLDPFSNNPITSSEHQASVETVAFSLDGLVLASGDIVGTTLLWGIDEE